MLKYIFLLFIKFYQFFISPWLSKNCRFYPTCSEYAFQSISTHGAIKGIYFAFTRLLKCHPFVKGGYDPIPKKLK